MGNFQFNIKKVAYFSGIFFMLNLDARVASVEPFMDVADDTFNSAQVKLPETVGTASVAGWMNNDQVDSKTVSYQLPELSFLEMSASTPTNSVERTEALEIESMAAAKVSPDVETKQSNNLESRNNRKPAGTNNGSHQVLTRRTTKMEEASTKEVPVLESSKQLDANLKTYDALGRAFAQKYLCPAYNDIHSNYISWMDGVGAWSYFVRTHGIDASKISQEQAFEAIKKGFWQEYEAVSKTKGKANPMTNNVDALLNETVVLSKKVIERIPAQETDVYVFLRENIQKPFKNHSKFITSKLRTSISADKNIGKGAFCKSLKDKNVSTKFTAIAYFERKVFGESKSPWYQSAWDGVKKVVNGSVSLVKKAGEKIVEGVKYIGQKIADFANYVASRMPRMEDDREMYRKFGTQDIAYKYRCAVQVSRVLIKAGIPIKGSPLVIEVYRQLREIGWTKVPNSVGSKTKGCVAYSHPKLNGARLSHIGIVGEYNGKIGIFDNSGAKKGSFVHASVRPYPTFYRQASFICPPDVSGYLASK